MGRHGVQQNADRGEEQDSLTMSWYLAVFQSCTVSMNVAFSSSLCGMPGSTVDDGQPFSPKNHRILGLPPPILFCSMS